MNEQRQQAYLNLIRSLLDFPSGEEPNILAANQELLDAGFVQTVEEVAQMCSQHGDENTANSLQGLAMQLREVLNLDTKVDLQSLSEEEIQTYYQFLMEVLQATADSKGNSQVVYPLLAKNTDKIDGVLAEILRRWGTNILREAQADEAKSSAGDIVNFSNLILQFPLGSKASNMEIAITGYEVTLTLYTREALRNWANKYLQNYYEQKDQWLDNLGKALKELASILHINEILTQIPKHCDKLILIPHQFLHLFPLHAIPINQNSENSSCLLDLFAGGVSYAPSCQLLQQVQQRKRPDFQSLFAIQNPTEDLNYTDLEVQVIQSYFNTSNVLKKTAATLTAINNTDLNTYHCAHFSCHGYFNFINPSQSALILANAPVADTLPQPNTERYLNLRLGEIHDLDKCLTLDKIFTLKLEKCRLVTLSACETGLIDLKNTSDEYIGLPSGFLLAGSQAVVSSLWTVSDLSTAFLMMKFYENLQRINSVSIALNQAQQWLRNLTIEEFEIVLEQYKPQIATTLAQMRPGQRLLFQEYLKRIRQGQSLPFANLYHWAAFTATGV